MPRSSPSPKRPQSTVTGLNDYRPVALTPIVMKCFERLVMAHIKDCVDVTVDPHQEQRLLCPPALCGFHLCVQYTIIPQTLVQKLTTLGLSSTLCNWVLDFLTDRPQSVRIHDVSSSSISLSTGSPQGCVLSPLLFTLLTYDCSAIHPSCLIVKFADDTAVVGRIANNDESDYRQEVEHLEGWCRQNNLCINVKKTKEMIVDFRRGRHLPSPLYIGGTAVEVGLQLQEAEARRDGELSPDLLLQMCGGERPVLLHHRVARQLLGGREEGSAEGGEIKEETAGSKKKEEEEEQSAEEKRKREERRSTHRMKMTTPGAEIKKVPSDDGGQFNLTGRMDGQTDGRTVVYDPQGGELGKTSGGEDAM
ncbi:hypothetical protein L3Q82_015366 [Scortum barcoo]|uniref:Uncharacterized protein n=1 Tax=Scortum barcoo TaxID=214431 RepID=A0ACB8VU40_9TELE|nr:hypothetical protein L3Q82_015366 [Scortum barcoo]